MDTLRAFAAEPATVDYLNDPSFDGPLIWRKGVNDTIPEHVNGTILEGRYVEGWPFRCRVEKIDWSKVVAYRVVSSA